ncbi:MAG: Na+/H+ antiporter NhaC family protein, partial [Parasutterella sp.]|nr:Na+/H+ antiporter NhaC family protein [Parasutterella sp.]
LTIVCLSATLAGSVFGDHCSPISDTTILSSAGSGCSHISHVSTQLPYAWFVACCCFVGYVAAGFSKGSWIISFGTTAVCFVGFLAFMWNRSFNVRAFAKNIHSPINIG